jgi:hypothetical protein
MILEAMVSVVVTLVARILVALTFMARVFEEVKSFAGARALISAWFWELLGGRIEGLGFQQRIGWRVRSEEFGVDRRLGLVFEQRKDWHFRSRQRRDFK